MWEKLKYLLRDDRWFLFLLACCLLVGAFLLGRLSVQTAQGFVVADTEPGVVLSASSSITASYTIPATSSTKNSVYGSINGARYYSQNCATGRRISTENKIYFRSIDAAEAAGYTQSRQCVFP